MMNATPINKLDSITFDQLLDQQDPFHNEDCKLDLSGIRFISPAAQVQLAALCFALAQTGRTSLLLIQDARFGYQQYDAFDIAVALSEVCQNSFDHHKRTCGLIAMQAYGDKPKQFSEIGIADYGDGLTATLNRNPRNAVIVSDLVAIQ